MLVDFTRKVLQEKLWFQFNNVIDDPALFHWTFVG